MADFSFNVGGRLNTLGSSSDTNENSLNRIDGSLFRVLKSNFGILFFLTKQLRMLVVVEMIAAACFLIGSASSCLLTISRKDLNRINDFLDS